ncbi:MAG TPA: CehA/McbA family metallohydrolase [Vicinamibacterales bacterium]|nr:CehA/McbA family metallohydrolase [Vicinamibacterales bacterium]
MHTAAASRILLIALILGVAASGGAPVGARLAAQQSPAAVPLEKPRWYKGNTHTHTLNSDGDSTPAEVVSWYREHNYQFLVLTDHNFLTSVDALNGLYGAAEQFLVIKGEEVTDRFGDKSLHINGLDVSGRVAPQGGSSVVDVLQRNVDAIRQANGIPHINHPNFRWAITRQELEQVRNNRLLEIFNGHPQVNNLGGGGVPGMEEAWDAILSNGTLLYGIAVDDAHTFKQPGNPDVPGPGRGWIAVRAARLEARALLDAIERGDFYASTGVEISDYQATARAITLSVKATTFSRYRVQFIGKGGRVLSETAEPTATYSFRGDEVYVRAKVIESNGRMAWTQPVIVASRGAAPAEAATMFLAGIVVVGGLFRWRHRSR